MLTIQVCVGSSCFLRGAMNVITEFENLIAHYKWMIWWSSRVIFVWNAVMKVPLSELATRFLRGSVAKTSATFLIMK